MLCKKYKLAIKGFEDSRAEHDELTQSMDPSLVKKWERQEQDALLARREDVQVMDIYEVQTKKRA